MFDPHQKGLAFIRTEEGDKWIVYKDEETQKPYFIREGVNTNLVKINIHTLLNVHTNVHTASGTEDSTWDDPRKAKPECKCGAHAIEISLPKLQKLQYRYLINKGFQQR